MSLKHVDEVRQQEIIPLNNDLQCSVAELLRRHACAGTSSNCSASRSSMVIRSSVGNATISLPQCYERTLCCRATSVQLLGIEHYVFDSGRCERVGSRRLVKVMEERLVRRHASIPCEKAIHTQTTCPNHLAPLYQGILTQC